MNWFKRKLLKKIQNLTGNPRRIAQSFALGSFIGVSPLIGMQIICSLFLSGIFHLNKTAAVIGVVNTNWTKGLFLYPINYKIGAWLLGINASFNISSLLQGNIFHNIWNSGSAVFLSLLAGGVVTGSVIAIIYYFLILKILSVYHQKQEMDTIMEKEEKSYALLTGASQGFGKAMAYELASRNINVLLVSLKGEGLTELCDEIRNKYHVDAECFETNFAQYESVYEVSDWATRDRNVSILINNAGIGGTRAFESVTPEYVDNIIQVNVRALSMLTRLMLPELKKHDKAYILNVASMASFSPFAYKTVYPASKAFVYSFSRGLHEELKGTNVFVSVIHPGPVKTNPEVIARIEKQGIFGKIGLVTPEKLAGIAIRQLFRRDSLILPGVLNKLSWVMMILLPNAWKLPLLSRAVRREITSLQPAKI
ncbi:MAG: SDR family NAD(P)-dependent oxidoreductase [Bacteroidota bacterium]